MSDNLKTQQLETELRDLRERVKRTAQYQTEKDFLRNEYQRSQDRFKTIFENSAIGKKIINDKLAIVNINPALLNMLGYTEAEMIGKLITDFTHPDFVDHWKYLQHELWTTDLPSFSFDTCLIKKDSVALWAHVTTVQIEDNGNSLGYTTVEDISERKELERLREIVREQEQRQQIAEIIFNTLEEERKSIAENLHNGLGQLLYGVKLNLNQINAGDNNNKKVLESAQNLLSECMRECRNIAHGLMPALLEERGLKDAALDICSQLSGVTTFRCKIDGFNKKLSTYLEVAIFRMIQELLLNIIKHAKAKNGWVTISEEDSIIRICVKDDGKGFDVVKANNKGIGIKTLRSKVALLGGSIKLSSTKNKGTKIEIELPKQVA